MNDSKVDFTVEDVIEIFGEKSTKATLKAVSQHYTELVKNSFGRNPRGYYGHLNKVLEEHGLPTISEEEQGLDK